MGQQPKQPRTKSEFKHEDIIKLCKWVACKFGNHPIDFDEKVNIAYLSMLTMLAYLKDDQLVNVSILINDAKSKINKEINMFSNIELGDRDVEDVSKEEFNVDLKDEVEIYLSTLTIQEKKIVKLRCKPLSFDEIAEKMKMNRGSVRSIYYKAIKKIRSNYERRTE